MLRLTVALLAIFALPANAHDDHPLSIAYDFEKIEDGLVEDVSGNGFHGKLLEDFGQKPSLRPPSQSKGVIGKAIVFEGNQHIDLGDNLFLFDEVTVMMWVNGLDSFSEHGCCPTHFLSWTETLSPPLMCGLFWSRPHLGTFCQTVTRRRNRFEFADVPLEEIQLVEDPIDDDDWHHIAAVFSGKIGRLLYIDGVLVANNPEFTAGFDELKRDEPTNTYIALGEADDTPWWGIYVEGGMDEFYLTRGASNTANVRLHMKNGVRGMLAVEPSGKLATTWAEIKSNTK